MNWVLQNDRIGTENKFFFIIIILTCQGFVEKQTSKKVNKQMSVTEEMFFFHLMCTRLKYSSTSFLPGPILRIFSIL